MRPACVKPPKTRHSCRAASREGIVKVKGDDVPKLAMLREAAREQTDAFLVATDMIDADQREATPGMREQP